MYLNLSLPLIIRLIKKYDLHLTCLFYRECKHTIIKGRHGNEAKWVLESQPRVGALEVLEVVDIKLLLEYHDYSVLTQFNIEHICLEIKLSKWPMLDVIPENEPIRWVGRVIARAHESDYICPKEHFS